MFFEMKRVYKEVRNNISKEPRAAKTAIEVEDQCTKDMRDFSWLFSCKSHELVHRYLLMLYLWYSDASIFIFVHIYIPLLSIFCSFIFTVWLSLPLTAKSNYVGAWLLTFQKGAKWSLFALFFVWGPL